MKVSGMLLRRVVPRVGRHHWDKMRESGRFSPADQGQDCNMARGAAQKSAAMLACLHIGAPRKDGGA